MKKKIEFLKEKAGWCINVGSKSYYFISKKSGYEILDNLYASGVIPVHILQSLIKRIKNQAGISSRSDYFSDELNKIFAQIDTSSETYFRDIAAKQMSQGLGSMSNEQWVDNLRSVTSIIEYDPGEEDKSPAFLFHVVKEQSTSFFCKKTGRLILREWYLKDLLSWREFRRLTKNVQSLDMVELFAS